jgi:RNA polymerase sigma-70 factor, ECF subfamily
VDQQRAETFTTLWIQAQPAVAAFLRALVPHLSDRDDLLQNVAVVALRKFDHYDPARPFVAWAIGIAKHEVGSLRRKSTTTSFIARSDLVERIAETCVEISTDLDERLKYLHHCRERLRGKAREVMTLRYRDELNPETIAERMKMSHGAVRVMLTRIRTALMECIERRLAGRDRTA